MHRASASVFLFHDIKISFGAFASTDSYVDLISTPENTRHKDAPARFHLAPKGHLLVCSTVFAILPVDVLLAAKKAMLGCHAAMPPSIKTHKSCIVIAVAVFIIISSTPSFIELCG